MCSGAPTKNQPLHLVLYKLNHWSGRAILDGSVPAASRSDWENSVTRRAKGFVLFSSSMAETRVPLLDLLPFFWRRAMKFSFREFDLGVLPSVSVRMSLLLLFTGDTRLWRLPNAGSLRPRTFRLDLGKKKSIVTCVDQKACTVLYYCRFVINVHYGCSWSINRW